MAEKKGPNSRRVIKIILIFALLIVISYFVGYAIGRQMQYL